MTEPDLGHMGILRCDTCGDAKRNGARCWYVVRVLPGGSSVAVGPWKTQREARACLSAVRSARRRS